MRDGPDRDAVDPGGGSYCFSFWTSNAVNAEKRTTPVAVVSQYSASFSHGVRNAVPCPASCQRESEAEPYSTP